MYYADHFGLQMDCLCGDLHSFMPGASVTNAKSLLAKSF